MVELNLPFVNLASRRGKASSVSGFGAQERTVVADSIAGKRERFLVRSTIGKIEPEDERTKKTKERKPFMRRDISKLGSFATNNSQHRRLTIT
jgi:hypothetical protein